MSNTVRENYRSLRIALKPTEEQKEFFNKSIGCMRLAYNEQLDHKINFYQQSFKNLEKTRIKLAKLNEKISNRRDFWIQNETKRLVSNYDKVVIENLNLQGMMKGFCNSKNYVDVSWRRFTNLLEQKGSTYNCKVVKADRFFPSTKLCHVCGFKNDNLTLKARSWICPKCQTSHNRDHNAAINLKNYDTGKTPEIGTKVPTTTEF